MFKVSSINNLKRGNSCYIARLQEGLSLASAWWGQDFGFGSVSQWKIVLQELFWTLCPGSKTLPELSVV